jgi:hypothetical protein
MSRMSENLIFPSDEFIDNLINKTYLTKTGVAIAICDFSIELKRLNTCTPNFLKEKVEEYRSIINDVESWFGFNGLRHASHSFQREFKRIFGEKE